MAPEAVGRRKRLAERRQKRRLVLIGAATGFLLCAVFGAAYSTHLAELRVARVEITGGQKVPHELVRAHLDAFRTHVGRGLFAKDNFFLFPRAAAAQGVLDTFPRLVQVQVRVRGLLEPVLHAHIEERTPFARWCREEQRGCFLMDEYGFVFATDAGEGRSIAADFYGSLTAEDVIGRVYAPDTFAYFVVLAREFERHELPIASLTYAPESNSLELMLARGFGLKILNAADPLQLANTLDTILASKALRNRLEEVEYIDMRFGNRIYYRFVDGDQELVPERAEGDPEAAFESTLHE